MGSRIMGFVLRYASRNVPGGGDAERKLRRVDHVERTVAEDHANPRDRVPRKRVLERLKEALLNHGYVAA